MRGTSTLWEGTQEKDAYEGREIHGEGEKEKLTTKGALRNE